MGDSERAFKRIERQLERLADQQTEIFAHLDRLDRGLRGRADDEGVASKELRSFLDGFRAGEALGEASIGAWIDVCKDAGLRGALRTIQQREGMHARLLEARLKEIGGSPEAEIPAEQYDRSMKAVGSPDRSDAEKLQEFMSRFSDPTAAVKPIHDMADRLADDPETQSLLRTIAQDELATLEFLGACCEQLSV